MSSPPNNDKPLPPLPLYKQEGSARRRRDSIYVQSNAQPIRPTATAFGESSASFYSFPRLPEADVDVPTTVPPVNRPGRTPSFSRRIASGIRSLLRPAEQPEEKKALLNLSLEDYEAGKQQTTADGANVFCQHIMNEECQCTVTMPIAVGRNLCQTCADGKCAATAELTNPGQTLKCRHLWSECGCTRDALWVTGDSYCGPCWYGLCPEGKTEGQNEEKKTV